jgi:hypothetical protein
MKRLPVSDGWAICDQIFGSLKFWELFSSIFLFLDNSKELSFLLLKNFENSEYRLDHNNYSIQCLSFKLLTIIFIFSEQYYAPDFLVPV